MPQPTRLTSGIARARRKLRTEGVDFTLVGTVDDDGNPTIARVRVPDLLDLGSLTKMPSAVQKIVQDRINEVEPGDAPPEALPAAPAETTVTTSSAAQASSRALWSRFSSRRRSCQRPRLIIVNASSAATKEISSQRGRSRNR